MFPTTGASKELSARRPRETTEDICPQAPHGTSKTSKSGRQRPGASYSSISRGVYMASDVYVSGQRAGGHPGYSSFFCDITPYLTRRPQYHSCESRQLAAENCRWYSGSGIYRHVWLINTEPTHIANHGIYVVSRNLGNDNWSLDARERHMHRHRRQTSTRSPPHPCRRLRQHRRYTANGAKTAVTVKSPSLWSPDSPTLYTLTTELLADGKPIDRRSTTTGFRSISYDSADGLHAQRPPHSTQRRLPPTTTTASSEPPLTTAPRYAKPRL